MEQLVARWAHNPKAVGSSPAPATSKAPAFMPGLFLCPFFICWLGTIRNQKE